LALRTGCGGSILGLQLAHGTLSEALQGQGGCQAEPEWAKCCWWPNVTVTALGRPHSLDNEQPTKNCNWKGKSDGLIIIKLKPSIVMAPEAVLPQCDFCQAAICSWSLKVEVKQFIHLAALARSTAGSMPEATMPGTRMEPPGPEPSGQLSAA
jgi:hypothetical protein